MLIKYFAFIMFSTAHFGVSIGQEFPSATKIDKNLTFIFPGRVRLVDTIGYVLAQMTLEKITYQTVKRENVFDQVSKAQWQNRIQKAANGFINTRRFASFGKQIKDTIIGGVEGKFIRMLGFDNGIQSWIFIFLTIIQTDIYSIQVTSFNN